MIWLRVFILRLSGMFAKRRRDAQLEEELQSHLEMLVEQNLQRGMPAEEARRAAKLALGGAEQIKEAVRDQRGFPFLESLIADIRFALRMLRKSPSFTAVAIVTLALGIGANTAIFSVVNSVVLRQPPYRDPERLVWVANFIPKTNQTLVLDFNYLAWRSQNHVFADMAAYSPSSEYTLTGLGDPERLSGARITASFLNVLGIEPRIGRNFSPEEDRPGGAPVVLLSDSLWRRRFSANPKIIGRIISLDGEGHTVIGVLPPQFEFLDNGRPDLITPFALADTGTGLRESIAIVSVVARLRPGVSIGSAAADLNASNTLLQPSYPGGFARMMAGARAQVVSLHEHSLGDVRTALLLMLGAVGLVLLIACANVANLQLARAVARESEMVVRSALGAGRWRLARQLVTESSILALCGGAGGVLLAWCLLNVVRDLGPENIPHLAASRLDMCVLLFTLALSLVTGILSGLAPIRLTSRFSLGDALKQRGTRTSAGLGARRSQQVLSVVEVALALVLFVGAGLLIRSFVRLISVPPGFSADNVLTARISLPVGTYRMPDQQRAFFSQLVERVQALPGVVSAGAAASLPLRGSVLSAGINFEGRLPQQAGPDSNSSIVDVVSPGYFAVLRIPLISGRLLDSRDAQDQTSALVVNQTFVRRFFPDEYPLGKRLQLGRKPTWWTIVGVVGDYKQTGLASQIRPEMFANLEQFPAGAMTLTIRTDTDPLRFIPAVRAQAAALDANLPLYDVTTMDDLLSGEVGSQRFDAVLLGVFAALALLLAAVGIFGVMAYAVSQRTHEFGIRMALGAQWRDVGKLVLGQGIRLALVGIALGLVASFALTRLMRSLLFGVKPTDPLIFALAALLLFGVMLAACYIPARRATRVDPMVALRYE